MFRNEIVYSKDVVRESHLTFWSHRKGAGLYKFLILLLIVIDLILGTYEFLRDGIDLITYFLIAAPFLFVLIIALRIYNEIKVANQRVYELYHGQNPVMIYEIADQIICFNSLTEGNNTFEYSQIVKVIESKNLIVLIIKGNLILSLKKDGFTLGSWEECKEFILGKCKESKR